MVSIGRKQHDAIVFGQPLNSLFKSDVSFNFLRQDVVSGRWFSDKNERNDTFEAPTDMSSRKTVSKIAFRVDA